MADELFDEFNKTLYRTGSPVYKGDGNPLSDVSDIEPFNIADGFPVGNSEMVQGALQSANFLTGVRGWQLTPTLAEFQTAIFNIGGNVITIDNTQDIQTNIDIIEAAGGGILYLQSGTYTLTSDISIPGGTLLKGVSRDGVIIDCDGTYKVQITGTNIYNTGTLVINDTETTVVGTGTTFTSGMVGRYIFLSDTWYEITAFTDTTHVTISPAYSGTNLSGYAVALASVNFNGLISTLTIIGATAAGFALQYAMEPILDDLVIEDNGTGIDADYVVFPRYLVTCNGNGVNLNQNFVEGFYWDFSEFSNSTTGANVIMTDTNNSTAWNFSCNGGTGNGISATNCSNIAYASYDVSNNGAKGFEFIAGCNDNQIGLGKTTGNVSDNIKLTATSDRNIIVASSIKDGGGYGINIAAATCDGNVINSPVFSNNSSGNINDSGTGTIIIADDTAYGSSWNGNLGVATKNAVYDKIETLSTGTKLSIVTTDVAYSSSTAETDLVSVSVTGGILSTNNGIRAKLYISDFQKAAAATYTFRFKYGSTTLATVNVPILDATTFGPTAGHIEFILLGAGGTSSQEGSCYIYTSTGNSTVMLGNGIGTSAEDSTTSKTLAISFQSSASNANNKITMSHAVLEIIR